jgi:hypothetical protein
MPLAMQFNYEEMVPFFSITGNAAIFEGPPPAPNDPVDPQNGLRNLRTDQAWFMHVVWRTTGFMNHIMCGKWYLRVFLEEMGIGEFQLMDAPIEVNFESRPHTYHRDIIFIAGTVPEGVYKPTLSLTMKGPLGVPGPIAAVAEGPVIQFYDVG